MRRRPARPWRRSGGVPAPGSSAPGWTNGARPRDGAARSRSARRSWRPASSMIRTCAPGSPAATRPIRAGNADIDVILLKRPHRLAAGRETVCAQERERVDPARPASGRPGPFRLEGTMDTPFHASANMRLAVDAIRRLCPTAGIRAVNLLARIRKGTYRETEWPGRIPVRNADRRPSGPAGQGVTPIRAHERKHERGPGARSGPRQVRPRRVLGLHVPRPAGRAPARTPRRRIRRAARDPRGHGCGPVHGFLPPGREDPVRTDGAPRAARRPGRAVRGHVPVPPTCRASAT